MKTKKGMTMFYCDGDGERKTAKCLGGDCFSVVTGKREVLKTTISKDIIDKEWSKTPKGAVNIRIKKLREDSAKIAQAFHEEEEMYFANDDREGWQKAFNKMKKEVGEYSKKIVALKNLRWRMDKGVEA